ncbi:serine protease grass [Drosophila rhopaloa]|uniref:Peptidase S1 domain-containing protein n=1 Tax=Drosophila rhopaloa TaxID=1041015 RepID=A0ABM5I0A8_DRORH|nr:serine protease grass [Drosophila rhopaloa]
MKVFTTGTVLVACLFLLANEGSGALVEEDCGTTRSPSRFRRLVNGENAERYSNPWMALVLNKGSFICSGSLITSRFVMTAATCVTNSPMQVILGEYERDCTSEKCSSSRNVIDIDKKIIHHNFGNTNQNAHDIALLQLATTVVFSDYIRPICLSDDFQLGQNLRLFNATGWGRTHSSESSSILQTTTLENIHRKYCNRRFSITLMRSQLCVGSNTSDTCNGDSGGPLTAQLTYENRTRTFQFGIVSFGSSFCSGLGIYTNVRRYMKWIIQTTGVNKKLLN